MRITLELDEKQTEVLQTTLETTLQSLVFQETQLKNAIDNYLKEETNDMAFHHLNDYNSKVAAQRVLIAEILFTINEADKKTKITTDLSDMPRDMRAESLFDR